MSLERDLVNLITNKLYMRQAMEYKDVLWLVNMGKKVAIKAEDKEGERIREKQKTNERNPQKYMNIITKSEKVDIPSWARDKLRDRKML